MFSWIVTPGSAWVDHASSRTVSSVPFPDGSTVSSARPTAADPTMVDAAIMVTTVLRTRR